MAVENIRHWRIGDVEVARIVEVNAFEDNISMLLPDATPQFVQQFGWLRPHFATPDGRMILSFQAFVLRSRGKSVMIDTCIGADRKREYEVFSNLQTHLPRGPGRRGLPAGGDQRRAVHAPALRSRRLEHAAGRRQVGADVPAGALPVRAPRVAALAATARDRRLPPHGPPGRFDRSGDARPGWSSSSTRISSITDEVSLIPTPGHTPGHVSVLIRSRGHEAVITGDLMHHPIQLAVPATHGNFDMDKAQGARSRVEFVDRFANRPALIIGSHFSDPSAGHIVSDGKGWKLVTE